MDKVYLMHANGLATQDSVLINKQRLNMLGQHHIRGNVQQQNNNILSFKTKDLEYKLHIHKRCRNPW